MLTNEQACISPIAWRDDHLELLDQRRLPADTDYLACRDAASVVAAIKDMAVRGAPAIGIAAAYGAVLAARTRYRDDPLSWRRGFDEDIAALRAARPTAVNLMWALDRMLDAASDTAGDPVSALLATAEAMHKRDLDDNRAMGEFGAALIEPGCGVLTHCNAGALATTGHGTALGVIRSAWARGNLSTVFATETRPWLQGARLTAWELQADGIDVTLIADGAAAHLMKSGQVQWVITGADRIAANGDTANKIGTYGLATLARAHGIGMMVVAPLSTIDLDTPDGTAIPIETRGEHELTHFAGKRVAALGAAALNPVFDVTPAALIDVLVTEKGAVRRPDRAAIEALFEA